MYTIQCDTHTHTLYSRHAYSTIEENVRAAKERGLTLLASTDHFGTMLHDHYDVHNYDYLASQPFIPREWMGVTVLRGLEADIIDLQGHLFGHGIPVVKNMMGGTFDPVLDLDERVLSRLDFAIASVHARQFAEGATVSQGTEMFCRVLENPKVFILGHICRSGVAFDYKEVIQCAKKNGKLLEINEHSFDRMDNTFHHCRELALTCAEMDASISLGTDAHIAPSIGRFDKALALLESVDFPETLIASRSRESFLSALAGAGLPIV